MSDDPKQEPTVEEPQPEEVKSEEAPPQATWEYRTEFRINQEMREVVQATIKVAQTQIDMLRRKVEKLQYGS